MNLGSDWKLWDYKFKILSSRLYGSQTTWGADYTAYYAHYIDPMSGTVKQIVMSMDRYLNIYKGSTCGGQEGGGLACFTGDTLVLTEDGLKEIKDIKVGDLVYSYNGSKGVVELKPVENIVTHEAKDIFEVEIEDETIKSSYSHPFYTINRGPIIARDLKVEDTLRDKDGVEKHIKSINVVNNEESQTVYEIKVQDNVNYFVGNTSILVFNENSVL